MEEILEKITSKNEQQIMSTVWWIKKIRENMKKMIKF